MPVQADRGYWYVVEAVPDPEMGGLTPGDITGVGWCAWYGQVGNIMYAAVRTPDLVTVSAEVRAGVPDVSAVLKAAGYSDFPYGRVGGR